MKKLFVMMFMIILLAGTVSAFTFDNNVYEITSDYNTGYDKIEIKNAFGLGAVIETFDLKEHTAQCLINCESTEEIVLYEEGRVVDDILFKASDGSYIDIPYKLTLVEEVELVHDQIIQDCTLIPGTASSDCTSEIIGNYTTIEKQSTPYNFEIKPAGEYELVINAEKPIGINVDFILVSQGNRIEAHAWWNDSWNFKKPIFANSTAFSSQSDYQMQVNFTFFEGLSPDFQDVRFVDDSDTTELDYWIENVSDGVRAVMWVELDTAINTTNQTVAYMYYNNSGAVNNSNGPLTFQFFDDCLVVNSTKWQVNTGSQTVTDGICVVNGDKLAGDVSIGLGHVSEARVSYSSAADLGGTWLYENRAGSGDYNALISNNGGDMFAENFDGGFSGTNTGVPAPTTFEILSISRYASGNAVLYAHEGVTYTNNTGNVPSSSLFYTVGEQDVVTVNFDWMRIRRFFEDTFVSSLGAEEENLVAPTVTLFSPANNTDSVITNIDFVCNVTHASVAIQNASLLINGTITSTNTSQVNGSYTFNQDMVIGSGQTWNCEGCNTDGLCANGTERTINVKLFDVLAETFNASTFDMAIEGFTLNVSAGGNETLFAEFHYDGVNFGNQTNTGNDTAGLFTAVIDIPIVTSLENKSFNWVIVQGSNQDNSTAQFQLVNVTTFTRCNATFPIIFMNISFLNETLNEETTTALISAGFTFSLESTTLNKTFEHTNTTENTNYTFCGSPSAGVLTLNASGSYSNNESQQRTFVFASQDYSNTSTEKVLYLLPTVLGIFTQFRTETILGVTIADVAASITRTISSVSVEVASGMTDDSGLYVVFLNPDFTYTGAFSKVGFLTNTFSFVPVTDVRTITMATSGETALNGSTIADDLTYNITPTNSSLLNNTNITFTFIVGGNTNVTFISMNITNSTGANLASVSNAGLGTISAIVDTANNTKLIGVFNISTATESFTIQRIWTINNNFEGDYSLSKQLGLFLDYGFSDFIRLLIVLMVMLFVVIGMSMNQITQAPESKVAAVTILIWIFSVVDWLNTGITLSGNAGITGLAQFSAQYGIAILTTVFATFFIGRRLFIRRP